MFCSASFILCLSLVLRQRTVWGEISLQPGKVIGSSEYSRGGCTGGSRRRSRSTHNPTALCKRQALRILRATCNYLIPPEISASHIAPHNHIDLKVGDVANLASHTPTERWEFKSRIVAVAGNMLTDAARCDGQPP